MFPIIANNYVTLASLSPPLALKQTIHSNTFHHCFYKFNNQALDLPHFKIFKNSAVRVKLLKNVKCAPLLECAAISLDKTNLEKIPPMGFDGMKNKHVILSWPFLSTLSIINTLLRHTAWDRWKFVGLLNFVLASWFIMLSTYLTSELNETINSTI